MSFDYLKEPQAIYDRSFAIVEAEAELHLLPAALRSMAVRLVHACGMTDLVADLAFTPDVADAAKQALKAGAPVICDCEMARSGVVKRFLPGNELIVTLNDERTPALAKRLGTTRSAAAVELWRPHLAGSVVVIGNAPTALFHLLENMLDGGPRPAAILAFPVGFVGANESKQALAQSRSAHQTPFITLLGRRGGSAMAAAALNAVAVDLYKSAAGKEQG